MNLPEEYKKNMQTLLGEEAKDFFAAMDRESVLSLRLNPLKKYEGNAVDITSVFPSANETVPWESSGRYYADPDRPGKHPLHAAGAYYIQEASAMAPASLLMAGPQRGEEKILDLCAAPGGKTTQIASYMKGRGLLVANEIVASRAKILSENVERCGIRNCIVTNCSPQELSGRFVSFFDRIMVDAPCSGEGMFRKNPEAVNEWSPENVRLCADRQDEILDCAASMLLPGGILVYSTCTFNPREDEGSVFRFLERHPEFSVDDSVNIMPKPVDITLDLPIDRTDSTGIGTGSGMVDIMHKCRILPHRNRGEGQFFVRLRKEGTYQAGQVMDKSVEEYCDSLHKILNKDQVKYFEEWCDKLFGGLHKFLEVISRVSDDDIDRCCRGDSCGSDRFYFEVRIFGTNLYLVPAPLPDLSGLKVNRWGLHLGSFEKKRFEPSHALALALGKADVKYSVDLSCDEAVQYLKGMTVSLPDEGASGWILVCTLGCSLGWGKAVGGILKNHYPRGLRWM